MKLQAWRKLSDKQKNALINAVKRKKERYLVVTSCGGLIDAVSFYDSQTQAIKAGRALWREMDYETDDCKVFAESVSFSGEYIWRPKSR